MKSLKLFIACLIGSMFLYTACEPDYDIPPANIPVATWKANTTILELKQKFEGTADSIGYKEGTTPYIIEGVVIGNDISGNIYKNIMVQDATAAITVSINSSGLYNYYRVGQKLVINCTGLYVGKYNNLQQLGYIGTSGMTFMPLTLFEQHTQLSGWPDSPIDTLEVTIPSLPTSFPALMNYQSQLIELKGVYFVDAGQPFAVYQKSTSRTLKDTLTNSAITVYNSGYSNFYSDILPSGVGDVVGILSYFGSGYQLLLRSRDDVFNFNGTPVPEDKPDEENSESNPYTITEAIKKQGETAVWVQGYIVGCVDGQVLSTGCVFSAPFPSQSNILLAAKASETTVDNLMPVQLVSGSAPRAQLNLNQNPTNDGKQVVMKCDITTYFGAVGIKNITDFKLIN